MAPCPARHPVLLSSMQPWRATQRRLFSRAPLLSVVIASVVPYAVGIRGDALFGTAVLAWWPTYFVVVFITIRVFPPDVEETGDYRGILFGVEDANDVPSSTLASADLDTEPPSPSGPSSSPRAMFPQQREPRTLEGVVLRGGLFLLIIFVGWMALRPLIYRIMPEVGATQSGPPGFPVTVHIGEDTMGVTNGSQEHWTCTMKLGAFEHYTSTFDVEPQETRQLLYMNFERRGQVDVNALHSAREKVSMICTGPSGTTHFW